MLSISQLGQLWFPIQLGEWFVILRLEKFIPALLNDSTRQQLLNGLFEDWIQKQVQQEMKKWCDRGDTPYSPVLSSIQPAE